MAAHSRIAMELFHIWDDVLTKDPQMPRANYPQCHNQTDVADAKAWLETFGIEMEKCDLLYARFRDAGKLLKEEHAEASAQHAELTTLLQDLAVVQRKLARLVGHGREDAAEQAHMLQASRSLHQASGDLLQRQGEAGGRKKTVEARIAVVNVMVSRIRDSTGLLCTICMNRDVDQCALPCGHMYCSSCADRMMREQQDCWRCRSAVTAMRIVRF